MKRSKRESQINPKENIKKPKTSTIAYHALTDTQLIPKQQLVPSE